MRRVKNICFLFCCLSTAISLQALADYNPTSGKRKLAYAPYQKVSLVHVAPQKEKVNELSYQLNSFGDMSIEVIVGRAKSLPVAQEGMIAAGWPGGKPSSQPSANHGNHAKPSDQKSHIKPKVHNPNGQNPHAKPSTMPGSQPNQPALSGFIYGQLELDESLKSKVKAGSVLFVIVRRTAPSGQKGMMIAATKLDGITGGAFPLKYVVKQSDAMMGAPLAGKVSVSARIDQDGDAISKQPGDIIGKAEKDVMVGVNPVVIKLNKSL